MPLALALTGIVLVLVGVRGTYADFAATLKGEFVGPGNFGYRAAAILMVGVIGYAGDSWRKLSVAMMLLLVLGLLVTKDRGFFGELGVGMQASPVRPTADTSVAPQPSVTPAATNAPPISLSDGARLLQTAGTLLAL
jgi:hypothetical protein